MNSVKHVKFKTYRELCSNQQQTGTNPVCTSLILIRFNFGMKEKHQLKTVDILRVVAFR